MTGVKEAYRNTVNRVRRAWVLKLDPHVDRTVFERDVMRSRLEAVEKTIQSLLSAGLVDRRRHHR